MRILLLVMLGACVAEPVVQTEEIRTVDSSALDEESYREETCRAYNGARDEDCCSLLPDVAAANACVLARAPEAAQCVIDACVMADCSLVGIGGCR